jgi:hypothetical protein
VGKAADLPAAASSRVEEEVVGHDFAARTVVVVGVVVRTQVLGWGEEVRRSAALLVLGVVAVAEKARSECGLEMVVEKPNPLMVMVTAL